MKKVDNVLFDTGKDGGVFIGIPDIGRFWLRPDGTYKRDIANGADRGTGNIRDAKT